MTNELEMHSMRNMTNSRSFSQIPAAHEITEAKNDDKVSHNKIICVNTELLPL